MRAGKWLLVAQGIAHALLWGLAVGANADLVITDDPVYGPGAVTQDTATGLEWLDLTKSRGYSVDEVLAGAGGFVNNGFRVASVEEVEVVFLAAGWDGVDQVVDGLNDDLAAVVTLLGLFGQMADARLVGVQGAFGEGWATFDDTSTTGAVTRPFYEVVESAEGGRIVCTSAAIPILAENEGFASCTDFTTADSFNFIGVYLVRETDPDPFPPAWEPNPNGTNSGFAWLREPGIGRPKPDSIESIDIPDDFAVRITSTNGEGVWTTTLTLAEPTVDGITELALFWTTQLQEGVVTETDLVDLTMVLRTPSAQIYTDTVFVNGVLQNIGTAFRSEGPPIRSVHDVYFRFNLDTEILTEFRNVMDAALADSTGTQYQVQDGTTIQDGGLFFQRYQNGDAGGIVQQDVETQSSSGGVRSIPGWRSTDLIDVDSTESYQASVWTFAENEGGIGNIPAIQFFGPEGSFLGTIGGVGGVLDPQPVGVWIQRSINFSPPVGATRARMLVAQNVQELEGTASVRFDDAAFLLLDNLGQPTGFNLISNPSYASVVQVVAVIEEGNNQVLVNLAETPSAPFSAVAETVVVAAPLVISSCIAPDIRWGELAPGEFNPRPLVLSELSFLGSCLDLSFLNLVMPAHFSALLNSAGTLELKIAWVDTEAVFEGLINQEENTAEVPLCADAPFTVTAPIGSFGDLPVPENNVLTTATVFCNRPRS
ncbi:MAG: hypothetical protein O7E57_10360, partial [Gammaproteobacteria bacterium]|nr:hypothetical protein [Gammaproteobacteria bacterium]